mmetsp:Transcript_116057/g.266323  ORF Transcript_116057/g.266323 Transcript_116057/m.266323 type:complete len:248 (-) Transcript_116057:914-1657(-)
MQTTEGPVGQLELGPEAWALDADLVGEQLLIGIEQHVLLEHSLNLPVGMARGGRERRVLEPSFRNKSGHCRKHFELVPAISHVGCEIIVGGDGVGGGPLFAPNNPAHSAGVGEPTIHHRVHLSIIRKIPKPNTHHERISQLGAIGGRLYHLLNPLGVPLQHHLRPFMQHPVVRHSSEHGGGPGVGEHHGEVNLADVATASAGEHTADRSQTSLVGLRGTVQAYIRESTSSELPEILVILLHQSDSNG